jgi:transcriptional regulator with XRE-family HTH domain
LIFALKMTGGQRLITAAQLRAARALLGIDQRRLAEISGLSTPTIQRMEASEAMIRGNVDSLMKLVSALGAAGIELIGEGAPSPGGGRGVRLKAGLDSADEYRGADPVAVAARALTARE